jgi:dienelactone hydrolase
MRFRLIVCALLLALPGMARADGEADNLPGSVRRIPPPGIAVGADVRSELQAGADALGKKIDALQTQYQADAAKTDLLPDVQIFYNAVRYPLKYNEFYNAREFDTARTLLRIGNERADALRDGKAPWTGDTGLVVRGYKSKIDASIQPYGLVIPADYRPEDRVQTPMYLNLWFHGRGETLTELAFLNDRMHNRGDFTPDHTIVLHLYGRYCNANKFAGEVDSFEAMDAVKRYYRIDPNRIAVRGFSMGGAACWQFATHFAGDWAAAAPGAGFSETPDFLKVYQNEAVKPTWYEQKLWHLYDSTDYAVNLFNCPTIAYSGELDGQRQAAVMMEKALAQEGMTLTHIIGPGAHHFYEANAKKEVAAKVDAAVAAGRDAIPAKIRFTTWTLRYNRMKWVRIDGLEKHWTRARLDAETSKDGIAVKTQNVSAFSILMPHFDLTSATKDSPFRLGQRVVVTVDGQPLPTTVRYAGSDNLWKAYFHKAGSKWETARSDRLAGLHKEHGLQGPIDDAFMDSFIMVRPTGTPMNAKVGAWSTGEMNHAIDHWRRQYRGEAIVKDDRAISHDDIANSNLVLWGDPESNAILKRIAGSLPIKWDAKGVHVGKELFTPDHNVPVLVYPNPLNPRRYVVINSGFTFREYDYLNNARQNAKLPDWAIVDIDTPPSSRWPGAIADAGFFNEQWQWTPDRGK